MKKIKLGKIFDLAFWSIIIILTCVELYNGALKDIDITEIQNLTLSQYIPILLSGFLAILICVFISLLKVFWLTVIYFGIKIATKKYAKDRIEKVDLKNDTYYRDILPKYSPAVLSYVDDFNIDKEDIVATLLMLELKGKIKIKQEHIVLLDDQIENLEENEIYILNKVKENNLKEISILTYTSIVKNDALKKGLLQEKQGVKQNIKRKIIVNIIIYLFVLFGFSAAPNILAFASNNGLITLGLIVVMILFSLLVFMPYTTIMYISHYKLLNTIDPYVRNKEGKLINIKLEGLRKYLVDFSKIEEKTQEQLVLWEDYLIYSVMLGINNKVIDEVLDKIK